MRFESHAQCVIVYCPPRDDMLDALSSLEDQLTTYLEAVEESKELEGSTDQYTQHITVLKAALSDNNHALHTLHTR